MSTTYEVTNQVPPLVGHDPIAGDTVLAEACVRHADRPTLVGDDLVLTADRLIVAAGSWTGDLLPSLAHSLTPTLQKVFYFRSPDAPEPVDKVGYFDQTAPEATADLRRNTILTLEAMGIPVEYSHHEIAPGQQEIDLRHADALTMADQIMTFRSVVKEYWVLAMQTGRRPRPAAPKAERRAAARGSKAMSAAP